MSPEKGRILGGAGGGEAGKGMGQRDAACSNSWTLDLVLNTEHTASPEPSVAGLAWTQTVPRRVRGLRLPCQAPGPR